MRRRTLEPPRPAEHGPVEHVPLGAPHEASPVPRAHFDPKRGWFRRLERSASLLLSRSFWPRCPGATIPYGAILARHLTVAEADVPLAGLPAALDGTTLLFVSDVHAGPFLSRGALEEAFSRLATLRADVVIHGGDIATSNVAEVEAHRHALTRLTAPLGVFAVYGNHDHYTHDIAGLDRLLEGCGIRVLNNHAMPIAKGGERIALAGVDDWNFGRPHLDRAFQEARRISPGAPVVLVSHNPDAFFEAAARGFALTLAGHTHGGQVRIPGRPVLVRMSRYRLDEGRYERGSAQLIVSRGLGVSGIPLRLFCPPEALLVTLRRPAP